MSTRASIKGHPIHATMIVLPAGLFVFSFICDLFYMNTGRESWDTVAYYTLAGALVTGLLAAIPGYIDYRGLVTERARTVGRRHMVINILALALGAVSLWLRYVVGDTWLWPVAFSGLAVLLLAVSGWAGATLVHVLGVSQPAASLAEREHSIREANDIRGAEAVRDPVMHDDRLADAHLAATTRRADPPARQRPWVTGMGGMAAHPAMRDGERETRDRDLRGGDADRSRMHVESVARPRGGDLSGPRADDRSGMSINRPRDGRNASRDERGPR